MTTVVPVTDPAEIERFCALAGQDPLTPDRLDREPADARWMVVRAGEVAARCSLWWSATPAYPGRRVGLIGHYAAADGATGVRLLRRACAELAARGCTLAVGPLDGDTFHRYRLVTERGAAPPFFLEPDNPPDHPAHFAAAGFEVFARYCSALQPELAVTAARTAAIERRLAGRGLRIRPLDATRFEDEVRRVYAVAAAGFTRSPLYAPIAEAAFVALYRPLAPFVVPELVLIAEREERPVGVLFVVPDWLQARRGEPVETVILKTVAVVPEEAGHGLVGLLIARGQEAAHALGYTRVIHALMHEGGASQRLSERYGGRVMRRYALFARALGGRP